MEPNCEVIVVFTGVKTGKTTLLENTTNRPKYFGVSIVEQDECIIDTGYDCNCRYIKMYKEYLHQHVFEPIILLAATNLNCWKKNFKDVYCFPPRFYSTFQWYQIFRIVDEEQCLRAIVDLFDETSHD